MPLPKFLTGCLLIFHFLSGSPVLAQTATRPQFYLYEDTSKTETEVTAHQLFLQNRFKAVAGHEVNVGFTRSVFWLAYENDNQLPEDSLLLFIGHQHINRIHFYYASDTGIGLKWITGDYFPFRQRPVYANGFYFPVTRPGLYLARIDKSNESLQLSFDVISKVDMLTSENKQGTIMAFFTGVLSLLILFGFYLFVISRDKIYVLYVLYMAAGWLWVLSNAGYGFQYIWPNLPWFASKARPVFALAPLIFSLLFLEPYIGGIRNRTAKKFINILNIVLACCIITILFFNEEGYQSDWWYYIQYIIPFSSLLFVIIIFSVLLSAIWRGNRLAVFYLFAIMVLLVFAILQVSFSLGKLEGSGNFFSNYGMSVGFIIEGIILTAGLVYRFNQYRLDKEVLLVTMNRQQQENTRIMMEVQEAERSQVANQLHDVAGSLLSAAKLNLSSLRQSEEPRSNTSMVHLQKTEEALDMVSEMVRNLSHALSPVMLQQVGFKSAIEKVIGIVNASGKVKIEYLISGFEIYDANLNKYYTALYSIIYELLNNIVKHSGAKHALIQVAYDDNLFSILSEDDGIGMDAKATGSDGIGLAGIRSKVEYFNGEIAFDVNHPSGLIVTISIPYKYDDN